PRRQAAIPVAARVAFVDHAHEREAAVVRHVWIRLEAAIARAAEADVAEAPHLREPRRCEHDRNRDGSQRARHLHQYPRRTVPSFAPFTDPAVSHSSDARNSSRRFFSHIALCDEHARSANTFCGAARSVKRSRTRSGCTCLSCWPATMSVGVCIFPTVAAFQPHGAVCGARRTPGPHVAQTGSDASISDQTASLTAGSYCDGQPTWRSQFAVNSSRDCVLNAAPEAGVAGAAAAPPRLYA